MDDTFLHEQEILNHDGLDDIETILYGQVYHSNHEEPEETLLRNVDVPQTYSFSNYPNPRLRRYWVHTENKPPPLTNNMNGPNQNTNGYVQHQQPMFPEHRGVPKFSHPLPVYNSSDKQQSNENEDYEDARGNFNRKNIGSNSFDKQFNENQNTGNVHHEYEDLHPNFTTQNFFTSQMPIFSLPPPVQNQIVVNPFSNIVIVPNNSSVVIKERKSKKAQSNQRKKLKNRFNQILLQQRVLQNGGPLTRNGGLKLQNLNRRAYKIRNQMNRLGVSYISNDEKSPDARVKRQTVKTPKRTPEKRTRSPKTKDRLPQTNGKELLKINDDVYIILSETESDVEVTEMQPEVIIINDNSSDEPNKQQEEVNLDENLTKEASQTDVDNPDDVIYVEPPPIEVVEVDAVEEEETISLTPESTANDFLTRDVDNISPTAFSFDFNLHGTDFQNKDFIKPTYAIGKSSTTDVYETESSSTSDFGGVPNPLFNEIQFPPTNFPETNLETFSEMITTKRKSDVISRQTPSGEDDDDDDDDDEHIDCNDIFYRPKRVSNIAKNAKALPELSPMQSEEELESASSKKMSKKKKKKKNDAVDDPTNQVEEPVMPLPTKSPQKHNMDKKANLNQIDTDESFSTKLSSPKKKKHQCQGDNILDAMTTSKQCKKKRDVDDEESSTKRKSGGKRRHSVTESTSQEVSVEDVVVNEERPPNVALEEQLETSKQSKKKKKSKRNQSDLVQDQEVQRREEVAAETEIPKQSKKKKKLKPSQCLQVENSNVEITFDESFLPLVDTPKDFERNTALKRNQMLTGVTVEKSPTKVMPTSFVEQLVNADSPNKNMKIDVKSQEEEGNHQSTDQSEEPQGSKTVKIDPKQLLNEYLTVTAGPSRDISIIEILSDSDDKNEAVPSTSTSSSKADLQLNTFSPKRSPKKSLLADGTKITDKEGMSYMELDVEAIQRRMPLDPSKWKIDATDRNPLKKPSIHGVRCNKCSERGHLARRCVNVSGPPKCNQCGQIGHIEPRCPNSVCTNCGAPSRYYMTYCNGCASTFNVRCSVCYTKGHLGEKCPDLWRRYYLTTQEGDLVQPINNPGWMKPRIEQWCACCARRGHLEYECTMYPKDHAITVPYIISYANVYPTNVPESNAPVPVMPSPTVDRPTVLEHRTNNTTLYYLPKIYFDHLARNNNWSATHHKASYKLFEDGRSRGGFISLENANKNKVEMLLHYLNKNCIKSVVSKKDKKHLILLVNKSLRSLSKCLHVNPCKTYGQIVGTMQFFEEQIKNGGFERISPSTYYGFDLEQEFINLNKYLFGIRRIHPGGDFMRILDELHEHILSFEKAPNLLYKFCKDTVRKAYEFIFTSRWYCAIDYFDLIANSENISVCDVRNIIMHHAMEKKKCLEMQSQQG